MLAQDFQRNYLPEANLVVLSESSESVLYNTLARQIGFYIQPMNGVMCCPLGKKTCIARIQYNVQEPIYIHQTHTV